MVRFIWSSHIFTAVVERDAGLAQVFMKAMLLWCLRDEVGQVMGMGCR
uniref:Uncharacterized protein n=1 Tax=Rhizophora mucronata TaxID=61149 RepID=A0A2P2JE80_RHIMU